MSGMNSQPIWTAVIVLIVSPSPAVPQTFMPLPSRNTSAGRPVVLDTALLPCPFSPPSEKETISDFSSPDGSALHGNAAKPNETAMCAILGASPGVFISSRRAPELNVTKQEENGRAVLTYLGPIVAPNHRQ